MGPTNNEYLDKAERTHDAIDQTLQRTAQVANETDELGGVILENLEQQGNTIRNIHTSVLNIEGALRRSDALIRNFTKRMSSDFVIQGFFCLNAIMLTAVIVYGIHQSGGLDSGDDGSGSEGTPRDDDTPSAT